MEKCMQNSVMAKIVTAQPVKRGTQTEKHVRRLVNKEFCNLGFMNYTLGF